MTDEQNSVAAPQARSHANRLDIDRRLQIVLAVAGGILLCVYWQSWKDIYHLFYDIPAALAMSAYIGQIVCEGIRKLSFPGWRARLLLMIPMSVIPAGREFLGWNISGHLTDILAVALIQSTDRRMAGAERIAYWFPMPIILYVRWFQFDRNGHWETFNAAIAAGLIFLAYLAVPWVLAKAVSNAGQLPPDAQ